MENCIFCKVVRGEVPHNKIAESEHFVAFLDIAPVTKGHTLVIPKVHSENFAAMSDEHGSEFVAFTQKVAKAVVAGVDAEGFNLNTNNGKTAGQAVFHTHFHIIPRFSGDGLQLWPSGHATDEEKERVCAAVKKQLQ